MSLRRESGQWLVGTGQRASNDKCTALSREISRREFLVTATALGLLSTAHCPLTTAYSQSADDWPQFRGNYNNTGVSPSQPPADLKLIWTYDAGDLIESSAAIAAGAVYVGTGKSALIAVDLQSGKLKWSYKT